MIKQSYSLLLACMLLFFAVQSGRAAVMPGNPGQAVFEEAYLFQRWDLAERYNSQGKFPEAVQMLQDGLSDCIAIFGEHDIRTVRWKGSLVSYMLDMDDYISPRAIIPDVFAGGTEVFSLPDQAAPAFLLAVILSEQGFRKEGSFYAKIFVGLDAFCVQSFNNNPKAPAPSGLNAQEIIDSLYDGYGLKNLNKRSVAEILARPNEPENTAYNKAAALMSGPEQNLYLKYGNLALKLAQAGKSGNQADKEKARKEFRAWMQLVHETLENPED